MGNSFVNIPLLPGSLTDHVGDEHTLFTAKQAYTIVEVNVGLLNGGGPVGGSLAVRIGTDLDGVGGVDYLSIDVLSGNQSAQLPNPSLPLGAGQTLQFRVDFDNGNSSDLFGTATLEAVLAVGTGIRYETLANVKLAIGGSIDASFDDPINDVIEQVSRAFDSYVGISFVGTEKIEFHDGWSFRNGLVLDRMPSEDPATRDNATVEENGTLLTQGDDWYFEPFPSRMIYRTNGTAESFQGARFSAGERNIKVTYESAFKSLPAEIILACRNESVHAWQGYNSKSGTGGRIGLNSRTPPDGTVYDFLPDSFLQSTLQILRPYREGRYVG